MSTYGMSQVFSQRTAEKPESSSTTCNCNPCRQCGRIDNLLESYPRCEYIVIGRADNSIRHRRRAIRPYMVCVSVRGSGAPRYTSAASTCGPSFTQRGHLFSITTRKSASHRVTAGSEQTGVRGEKSRTTGITITPKCIAGSSPPSSSAEEVK